MKLPDDYRAFLARIGALHVATEERASMYEDMFVYGHVGKDGPGDLDITRVRPDLEEWGSAPEVAVPILFCGDHRSLRWVPHVGPHLLEPSAPASKDAVHGMRAHGVQQGCSLHTEPEGDGP